MNVQRISQTKRPDRYFRKIEGQEVLFDGEGFIWDPGQWSRELARLLARETGLNELQDVHWKVLRFIRGYYLVYGRAPLNREIKQNTGLTLMEMEALFPGGIKYGARLLAGLPNPKSCL